jgi:hypothetical protein
MTGFLLSKMGGMAILYSSRRSPAFTQITPVCTVVAALKAPPKPRICGALGRLKQGTALIQYVWVAQPVFAGRMGDPYHSDYQ